MNSNGRDDKRDEKHDHKMDKAGAKEGKILAKAELSKQKAAKRKWLVMLIGIGIAAFYALKSGAGSGLIDIIKSKLGM